MENKQDKQDKLENWLKRHNHELELIRTITAITTAIVSTFVFLRVFGILEWLLWWFFGGLGVGCRNVNVKKGVWLWVKKL